MAPVIDISFDFRTEATGKRPDADASSLTLLRYHQLLWSKPLPSGRTFELTPRLKRPCALVHSSDLGQYLLTSDSVLVTFTRHPQTQGIVGRLPPGDMAALDTITRTIGGKVMWPGNQIGRKWTINQARGCSPRIADRFDLTLECIRLHYEGDTTNPLAGVFARYRDFFDLFDDFRGYVDFWILNDLVDPDGAVRFFLPSNGFALPSVPQSADDYRAFCDRTIEFVTARNKRIQQLGL